MHRPVGDRIAEKVSSRPSRNPKDMDVRILAAVTLAAVTLPACQEPQPLSREAAAERAAAIARIAAINERIIVIMRHRCQ
jgi:hypothetical protein